MWSDPSSADIIPASLQKETVRFPFGRLQALAFLQRLGCHTIIRGHEKVLSGFEKTYDDSNMLLITLFSCGGKNNNDFPVTSGFRKVTPMALTLTVKGKEVNIKPWPIDYQLYNKPEYNSFFKMSPAIEHIIG
jgi:hypothetical protein